MARQLWTAAGDHHRTLIGAESVAVGDLDGDGDFDVLSASGDDKIAWYENTTARRASGRSRSLPRKPTVPVQ